MGQNRPKTLIDPAAKSVTGHKHALHMVFTANVGCLLNVGP